jgi:amino acid adenylation domain-containing protein
MQALLEPSDRAKDSYPLSPMQAGMLFNALLRGMDGVGVPYDIEQLHLLIDHAIDPRVLRSAWSAVFARHAALGVSVSWSGSGTPRQRTNPGVPAPLEVHDWTRLDASQREHRRKQFLAADRARGFDLRTAPLHRLTLFRVGPNASELIWTFHHIVLDGRSLVLVLTELFKTYAALTAGVRPATRPPERAFREFVESLQNSDPSAALAYFRSSLRGKATPTPLPYAETTAGPTEDTAYSSLRLELEPRLRSKLEALAQSADVSLGHIARAAWAIVLARHTGDADVVFGVARQGRHSALNGDVADVIGMFMNVSPVRVRLSETATLQELLTSIRDESVAVRPFEHTPLADAQRESDVPRGTPLIQTLLLYEEELNTALERSGGAAWRGMRATLHEQPTWPLSVKISSAREALRLEMIFDTRRLRRTNVARLLDALRATLEDLSAGAQRRLRELTAVPAAELQRVVRDWNATERPFPDDLLIHELFEQRVRAEPDAVALESREGTLTYRELDERANQLAHALVARGVGPGSRVGICLGRGPRLVLAILASCKAGATYLPLDAHYADERLAFMVEDARARLVLSEARSGGRFSVPTLLFEELEPELAGYSTAAPARAVSSASACYVIFTSGSSGVPKGVVLSHRAVVNTLDWVNRTFGVSARDRLLFVTSPSFDLSVYDMFGILGAGGTLVIADDELLNDVESLAASLQEKRITIWNSAPAALQRVLPFVPSGGDTLRLVLSSGDWLPLRMIPTLRALFPRAELVNLGGATEAAIWSNWYSVATVDPDWNSVPYGRPLQNCRYYVLDAGLRPAPIGVVGELYIGGICLADRYLNRPELTAERFIPDPFSSSGERLYRTFDLARWKADGNLELIGRLDSQVKIRGFRVELGEVEAALTRMPEVRAAVCAARRDASGSNSLIAYVVPHDAKEVREEAIKRSLSSTLPDFMVPSRVIFLGELPLSANGKLDRDALEAPLPDPAGAGFVAPSTETERWMVQIWQRSLQRASIGINDDFFALGGHSLIAVELFNEVNSQRGARLPLATLFECPTVRLLAARLDELGNDGQRPWSTLVPIQPRGALTPFFCIAGLGGDVMEMRSLALALGVNQPFFGLQYRGVDGLRAPHRDILAMAREFAKDIRQRQPHGPYYLGGFSAGGIPAYEVAQMLSAEGEPVALLALLDSLSPTLAPWSLAERITLYGQRLRDGGLPLLSDRIKTKFGLLSDGITQRVRVLAGGETSFELRHAMVKRAYGVAMRSYVPRPYDGRTLLIRSDPAFRPGIGNGHHPDPNNGWQSLIRELDVVLVHCDHDDLLRSHVETTARTLRSGIASPRSASSPPPSPATVFDAKTP